MRIARFKTRDNKTRYGVVEKNSVNLIKGDILGEWRKTDNFIELHDVTLLAPIIPPNLLAIGRNYKAHAQEGGDDIPKEPILFIKATSTINNPDSPIILPTMAPNEVDYEAELAIVIGKSAKNISDKETHNYVLGYTCANDVSARDCQRNDAQWARGKSFDTFAPLGPWIETELNPDNCNICSRLNGKVMQKANTSQLIFNTSYLISYLSKCMTLLPGTVILTGTPAGCGFAQKPPVWLKPGDMIEIEVENIGVLRNTIIFQEPHEI